VLTVDYKFPTKSNSSAKCRTMKEQQQKITKFLYYYHFCSKYQLILIDEFLKDSFERTGTGKRKKEGKYGEFNF